MIVTQEYIDPNQTYISSRVLRTFNFFWLGFIIYTGGAVLYSAMPYQPAINKLQLLGLGLMFVGTIGLIQFKLESPYLKILYFLYIVWLCITVSRGIKFDRIFLFNAIFTPWSGLLPYFTPVILLFPKNVFYLKKLFVVAAILGLLFLVLSLVYRGQLLYVGEDVNSQALIENFAKTLSIPCGFLLLTYIYQPKWR